MTPRGVADALAYWYAAAVWALVDGPRVARILGRITQAVEGARQDRIALDRWADDGGPA